MCCLHKQCHISVNIICHPDILDWIQFPLGFAQLGTWLLQQTANSIRANACLRQICVSGRHTFLPDDPCYTWHEERISNVQPTNLCFQAQLRQSKLTLPHQHCIGLCGPQQPASPPHLSGDPQSLPRFLSRAPAQNIICIPAVPGST